MLTSFQWRMGFGVTVIAITLCILHEISFLPDGKFYAHILDIGQGDAILLVSPSGKQILIDGGESPYALEELTKYMSFFDRSLDLMILTHPHADHLGTLPEILERYDVKGVVFPELEYTSGLYEKFLSIISRKHIPVLFADPMQDIDLGDGVILNILWPNEKGLREFSKELNNISTTIRVTYKNESILLTGDIEVDAEKEILRSGVNLKSDILKIGHHGSRTSTSTGFLLTVNPRLAVMSAGRDNAFGHPHQEILERLQTFAIPVRSTKEDGAVSLTIGSAMP